MKDGTIDDFQCEDTLFFAAFNKQGIKLVFIWNIRAMK